MILVSSINSFATSGVITPTRLAIINWVLSSAADPFAICTNLAYSKSESRSAPSAMFEGIETAARVIWSRKP